MIFWIAVALTLLVITGVLISALFSTGDDGVSAAASDISVYRDQLDEVERDLARGVLTETEAEAVRIEVSRRLLDADKRNEELLASSNTNQYYAASFIVICAISSVILYAGPAFFLSLLGFSQKEIESYQEQSEIEFSLRGAKLSFQPVFDGIGAPGVPDLPMAERLAQLASEAENRPSQSEAEEIAAEFLPAPAEPDTEFKELMVKLRSAVAENPNDIQGLTFLARNEARLGNYVAARQAQERLVQVKGDDVSEGDLAILIEMMVFSTSGFLSPEAEGYLQQLLTKNPENGFGRYFLGLLFAQNGRPDQAFPVWRRLLEDSSPDAPWLPVIRAEIGNVAASAGVNYQPPALRGPDGDAVAAAEDMTAEDRTAMIQGMVEGLASRLANDGGTPEEWVQLINALMVLGQEDRARAIYAEAKTTFGASEEAMRIIFRAGIDAGLE